MVKFVLLGHKRCGSTLLSTSLTCHENVYMFGELFNESEEEREQAFRSGLRGCRAAKYADVTERDYYRDGDAAAFLDRAVYYEHYWEPVSVGFKMFYEHCRTDEGAVKAWNYLIKNKEIHVVHLLRLNLLETLLSLIIARKTNEWARFKGSDAESPPRLVEPFHLSPQICEDYFLEITRDRRAARANFAEHPVMEITYEDHLCRDYQGTFDSICDFLKIPAMQTEMLFEKQATRRPSQQISNYAELKGHFSGSEYAGFFE
ncbi:MAG TPA: sulfotransferase [Blastocatellia bacterium]|nr:sulfotransferase [Blastocatellia bacterium]